MAVPSIACSHGSGGIAMHIGNHNLSTSFELGDEVTKSPNDLAYNLVHLSTHVQIEIRLNAKLFEHPSTQVLIVVLSGMPEDNESISLFELLIERNLLDDIGFRGDQDQVHMPIGMIGTGIVECL